MTETVSVDHGIFRGSCETGTALCNPLYKTAKVLHKTIPAVPQQTPEPPWLSDGSCQWDGRRASGQCCPWKGTLAQAMIRGRMKVIWKINGFMP